MKLTDNLKLKKPDLSDYVNIEDLNENMDIIDDVINKIPMVLGGNVEPKNIKAGDIWLREVI